MWTWGGGSEHQLGTGRDTFSHVPQAVTKLDSECQAVIAGDKFTLALSGRALEPEQQLPMHAVHLHT